MANQQDDKMCCVWYDIESKMWHVSDGITRNNGTCCMFKLNEKLYCIGTSYEENQIWNEIWKYRYYDYADAWYESSDMDFPHGLTSSTSVIKVLEVDVYGEDDDNDLDGDDYLV